MMGFARAQPILVIARSIYLGMSERNALPRTAAAAERLAIGSYPILSHL